jgi:hypothetical protein
MALKDKIASYVERYGYNLKAFLVCTLVFPPAALFIALKHPSWSTGQRAIALTSLVAFLAVIPFVGAAIGSFVIGTAKSLMQ